MNLELIVPSISEYWYEAKLLSDTDTMSYNAGYDVNYYGYSYTTGCIDFPKERWEMSYQKRIKENRYFAYIKDKILNEYVGYVNYHYNKNENRYECGVVIEAKHRKKGYAKNGLILLCKEAFKNGVDKLYDNFEEDRTGALKVFLSIGFKIEEYTSWKKFNNEVKGVVVSIDKETFDNGNLM